MTPETIEILGENIDTMFFMIGGGILLIEIMKGLFSRPFRGRSYLDMVTSISTQIPSIAVEVFIMGFAYAGYVWLAENYVDWTLPINIWTILLAILVCDFVYYWEHRFAHEWRVFWTQHAVHHSSRYFNAAVAIRFGPFEGLLSAIFHLPLVFLGFPPSLVFMGILTVLAYQTWIHTELIGKLGILEGVLNTPSNHRVHHGCDEKYIDKNYGGILIIWDRLFGSYQAEEETPQYGLKRDFSSINPFVVWFSEVPQFLRDLGNAQTMGDVWRVLFGKPGWQPSKSNTSSDAAE
ncbi:MAG: sterol desaturase family protein [Aquisalinus sp.]|nr:sterol desaturase family protein [Aquisalinus sp.]